MKHLQALTLLLSLALISSISFAQPPQLPEGYVAASELLPLPDFIPGAGALYIDPANAPIGPWIAYGNNNTPVEILYMLPLSQLNTAQNYDNLSTHLLELLGASVDHVDVTFNGGHPGMAEQHYHIRLSLLAHDAQETALTQ